MNATVPVPRTSWLSWPADIPQKGGTDQHGGRNGGEYQRLTRCGCRKGAALRSCSLDRRGMEPWCRPAGRSAHEGTGYPPLSTKYALPVAPPSCRLRPVARPACRVPPSAGYASYGGVSWPPVPRAVRRDRQPCGAGGIQSSTMMPVHDGCPPVPRHRGEYPRFPSVNNGAVQSPSLRRATIQACPIARLPRLLLSCCS